jgi:hypothetical protein
MKRLLLLLSFSLIFTFSFAKEKPWRKGKVMLSNGDTLSCTLRFTRKVKEGLLQIQDGDNKLRILTVKQVRFFEFFDEKRNQLRFFKALSAQPELSGKKHQVFMEIIYRGAFYSIANHRMIGYSEKSFHINPFGKKTVVDNPYLLDHQTNEALPLSHENLLKVLRTNQREVNDFIQTNGPPRSVNDYMKVLEYHQTLL